MLACHVQLSYFFFSYRIPIDYRTFSSDYRVLCLGLVQALFEGAMYTFVLEWTPALTQVDTVGGGVR